MKKCGILPVALLSACNVECYTERRDRYIRTLADSDHGSEPATSPSSSKNSINSPTYYTETSKLAFSTPSTSFTSSSSSSISCDNNENPVIIQVDITTDDYPGEISWKVADLMTNFFAQRITFGGGPYPARNTPYTEINEVCPQDCFKFKIFDSHSAGFNDVSYQVSYDSILVHEGRGDFGSEESSILFGDGCPSTEPSTSVPPLSPISSDPVWMELGSSINTDSQYFAMASNRLVVAVRQEQTVLVYRFENESMSWGKIANAIEPGFTYDDESVSKLALSSDGGVVAISDQVYDSKRGRVQIFASHPTRGWIQLGFAIDGECYGDRAGSSVAFSSNGATIAIGARWNDGNGNNSGDVRVFSYNKKKNVWTQRGDAIHGEASADESGSSVAISADGSIIAVGAIYNDGSRYNSGHVRVYEFSVQGQSWVQRGSDLDGEARLDYSGWSVAMSEDGEVLAIAAIQNSGNGSVAAGRVRVFQYSTPDEDWVQRGNSIDGEAARDNSGYSVDISADGITVAIGSPWNDGNGINAGHVRIYDFDILDNLWVQRGTDLDGETADSGSGYDVVISADGRVVGSSGANSNKIKLMKWTPSSSPTSSILSSAPNCADGQIQLRINLSTDRFPKQTKWNVKNINNETILSGGPYYDMFSVHTEAYCLDQGCYQFTIQDSSSDGICCDWFTGEGNYELYFNSTLIKKGGRFASEEITPLGSTMCPSHVSPSQPTYSLGLLIGFCVIAIVLVLLVARLV